MQRKHKPKIVNNDGDSCTLDAKHDEVLSQISNEEKSVEQLEETIRYIKSRLKNDQLGISLSEHFDLKEEIKTTKSKIHSIKKKRDQYYLQNSKYIFQYFENKQSIATDAENKNKNYILNDFFKLNRPNNAKQGHAPAPAPNYGATATSAAATATPGKQCRAAAAAAASTSSDNPSDNEDMLRYLLNINEMNSNLYHYVMQKDVCSHCNKGEMVMYDSDGILICTNCSRITKYIIEHEKPSYKEPPKEVCFYAYKRINHFREILAQFQAKESTQIPEKVLEDFKMQIKKERISIDQLTNKKAKEILKKLNHSKYYEHVPFIKDKIGIKPPVMDNKLEETLCNLFLEIQAPYAKYCPDSRVNFLNYYYTIYKLCELLDKKQFLEYFPMLKDKSKRIEQDNIWKNICKELNWKFIPTV